MRKTGSIFTTVITVLITLAIAVGGLGIYSYATGLRLVREEPKTAPSDSSESTENLEYEKLKEIDGIITNSFLGDFDREEQWTSMYNSMVDSLGDEYSRYLSSDELKQLKESLNSTFSGTGIFLIQGENEGEFIITEVISGGPAYVAGVKEGDILLMVDGVTYKNHDDVVNAIKGTSGAKVELKIRRDDEELTIPIVRGDVKNASVESRTLDKEIGYIRLRSFGEETFTQFDSALSSFEQNNVKGLIIDMRNNTGGLFNEGVKIADRLLPEGLISYTIDKKGERENYNSDGKKTGLKMVVLINGKTASTAEMLAGAVKASGLGTLVGKPTFGKGLIQETHVFKDGSAVTLTTMEFFAADGGKINQTGITPDVEVDNSNTGSADKQLDKAVEIILKG